MVFGARVAQSLLFQSGLNGVGINRLSKFHLNRYRHAIYNYEKPFSTQRLGRPKKSTIVQSTAITEEVQIKQEVNRVWDKITIIADRNKARAALDTLKTANVVWACDTEVADIDVKTVGPVGNGRVTCVSIYGGPSIDFGFGEGPGSALWVDNLGDDSLLREEFKEWFENNNYKKVWHNYGFDRHVMYNEGVDCRGFAGDTMHMARLWDTSRDRASGGGDGYSLESLSDALTTDLRLQKIGMKELFGKGKLKRDGTESKIKELPDIRELQLGPHRERWIEYSAKDAVATWHVFDALRLHLMNMVWQVNGQNLGNMMDFYNKYLRDFGELLTDMERVGIKVDTQGHLVEAERKAIKEKKEMEQLFRDWLAKHRPELAYRLNIGSSAQMMQLLFGTYESGVLTEKEKSFKIEKSESELQEQKDDVQAKNPYVALKVVELKELLGAAGLPKSGKKAELVERLLTHDASKKTAPFSDLDLEALKTHCIQRSLSVDGTKEELVSRLNLDASYAQELSDNNLDFAAASLLTVPKAFDEVTITTFALKPEDFTPGGQPQVSAAVLKKLAGQNLFDNEKTPVWGLAFQHFGGGEEGAEACRAIGALANVGQIDATITNFLIPLQRLVDRDSRIHCSLNLNTETGRLSSRRPNLQNQPALEKDQYRIRDAFVASEGKTLIVADYGQLELRLLAHITGCKSMVEAFLSGGCFHSRTAMGMYPHIKQAVDAGEVLLEWDYSKGPCKVPLVKDKYGSERRKAKTLNFSIAYGKTVHGLAQDWGISKEEAEKTLEAWYRDRPEVKAWQDKTKKGAKKEELVRTILGRQRRLPDANGNMKAEGHALRAAINTPIQGSAADVVMLAMIKLWKSEVLASLGWKLLLQIHDEVILEGPVESRDAAMAEVRSCMEQPFDEVLRSLSVHLDVDAKSADSWYKAK